MTKLKHQHKVKYELQTREAEMERDLKELGYDVQDAQVLRARGCAGAMDAGGVR